MMIFYTHTFNSTLRNTYMGLSRSSRDGSGYKTATAVELLLFCGRQDFAWVLEWNDTLSAKDYREVVTDSVGR
jgi:hypothetical protein